MLNMKKKSLYKYHIKDLKIFGYHGVYDKEIKDGQTFKLNIFYVTSYDTKKIKNDNIENVVDYINVIKEINSFFKNNRYNLIESLINDLHEHLNEIFNFKDLEINISKKNKKYLNNIKYKELTVGNE